MSAVTATIYRTSDGAVLRVMSGHVAAVESSLAEGEAYVEGNFLGLRIDPETEVPVPLLTFDLTIEPNRIAGLPPGTVATMDGEGSDIVDDGAYEISVSWPEVVSVNLWHPAYNETTVEVDCEADT